MTNNNTKRSCPRLIEVALPIQEISSESVRDKSLRHGHISTLHLWWARRPLPASRAVVFASLVPDPDDPECPEVFCEAVAEHLKTRVPAALKYYQRGRNRQRDDDPYKPYEGLSDTLRNRLLAFVAKWSPESLAFEAGERAQPPSPNLRLDDRSLIKWETSDPNNPQGKAVLRIAHELVLAAYGGKAPTVLDPFAGGGAIPLEAGRLGCQPIANDYNPVAHLIQRATCEFPQQYGKPGLRKRSEPNLGTVESEVPNVLAHDVEQWVSWILTRAQEKIGTFYPAGKDGRLVIGYLWARTAPCSNPSCRGEIPLLRTLLVCNKKNKKVALRMEIDKNCKGVHFDIVKDFKIEATDGTMQNRGNVLCPYCKQIMPAADLRATAQAGKMGERMVAVIVVDRYGKDGKPHGKDYRPVEQTDLEGFDQAIAIEVERPQEKIYENIIGIPSTCIISPALYYGMPRWGDLFNPRQLVAMQTFLGCLHEALEEMKTEISDEEYRKALGVYLGLWLSRSSMFQTNVGRWLNSLEAVAHPFSRQAIPMVWDYPEVSPFATASGGARGQLRWMTRFIEHEQGNGVPAIVRCGDGATLPISGDSVDVVVTDPPYFDAIAYSDLSDFFYVWIKRALGRILPESMMTPLTPKRDEATALKHRHAGDTKAAEKHFTKKLMQVLVESKRAVRPAGIITVMFAHQSTAAWISLINALFRSGLTIMATWPIDTEREARPIASGASALASSITVACRFRTTGSAVSFRTIRQEMEQAVQGAVRRFWGYGFRGADLIVACYGPAVGVFGKYERVEKADGTTVKIPELLKLVRQEARNAIAGGFDADNLSTLYYVWVHLHGTSDQSWDDARLLVQISGDAEDALEIARSHRIFKVNGATCSLALLADREANTSLGMEQSPPLIDSLHRSMLFWREEKRGELVTYLTERGLLEDDPFWQLAQALFEELPRDSEDWKLVAMLLSERETLRTEGKRAAFQGDPNQHQLI